MSLILAGLVLAGTSGALLVGRWLARRGQERDATGAPAEEKDEKEEKTEADARAEVEAEVPAKKDSQPERPAAKPAKRPPPEGPNMRLEGFACQLGDVLLRITGEEAWLAGGLVLSEAIPVAVLFVAPDAKHDCAIWVRAAPRRGLWWLEPLDPNAILVGGEPPSSVEHRGIRFERERRLPLRVRRIGVGAPNFGDAVMAAEYESVGAERLLVLKGNAGTVQAYRGVELDESAFEVIASGESTLE